MPSLLVAGSHSAIKALTVPPVPAALITGSTSIFVTAGTVLKLSGKYTVLYCVRASFLSLFFVGSLFILNGCLQSTAMVGPSLSLAGGGNVYQAGFSYGAGKLVEEETGMSTAEYITSILEKEAALGKLEEDNKDARVEELNAWDDVKLEGFSIAMESMPVPEEAERTFGKGKAHDAEESPVEVEEVPRMFAMKDGKISFTGEKE